ncbi:DNA helicase IV [Arsenophonus nasoniae]|uniref:DNA 3'-5' helicase n=1 Tax=Arsenophonus nasoniae TaxID=638 RepID=D2TZI8_9GAMM|nr:DNA helicase IV [Arsenophonus nasoniae]QBY42848.1 Helicase IV [Arsenophonus nasoniae]WGL96184.1 DNA helicase IV [Arsenophonus nasoniae]WGM06912.1 DNA helicase IV [Arsenophonus nasoniae]WGM11793.1 DNA helicase IV [Arsenophonus nasoniae]WGM16482.1 DNA helicase IV [Arsenophonus nasoniae]
MELKSTHVGQRLAQHPYNRVRLLNAGVEVSGEKHQYLIPFNQLVDIRCKRGIVWGELEFELPNNQVVRLHGTEWKETQYFFHYLMDIWKKWSQEMSLICADILSEQVQEIEKYLIQDSWFTQAQLNQLQNQINSRLNTLPMPLVRLYEFVNCRQNFAVCQHWLNLNHQSLDDINQYWVARLLKQYSKFFQQFTITQLNLSQVNCVVNSEENILVLGGPGSGKTSILIAKMGWLLLRQLAITEQILLLAFDDKTAKKMDGLVQTNLGQQAFYTKTFHSLVLHIIQTSSNKNVTISELEVNEQKRYKLLINEWQKQCHEKKSQAKGWREFLTRELAWDIANGEFWHDKQLAERVVVRLDNWLNLLRRHGGSQKTISELATPVENKQLQMELRLVAPIIKIWKSTLKAEGAVDSLGLIHQAINLLHKGKFISPWKYILIDEFQDLSPLEMQLLQLLRAQNRQTHLFAVGDDEQAIYRFPAAKLNLMASFEYYFASGAYYTLETTYRFNDYIAKIANQFIQKDRDQQIRPLKSVVKANKKSIVLLPDEQLENLLNKMSGYVTEEETILVLSRYFYLQPAVIKKANIRWPKLKINFMPIQAAKGCQADYVVILGLQQGIDGFPVCEPQSAIEKVLLTKFDIFPDQRDSRLLYVALTRAKKRVYLLYDKLTPSIFVEQLKKLGVSQLKRP